MSHAQKNISRQYINFYFYYSIFALGVKSALLTSQLVLWCMQFVLML